MRYLKFSIADFSGRVCTALTIFLAASFLFLINSMTNFSSLAPYLSNKLHFSTAKIGFLFACYSYSNILFVFWAGVILDRFSLKKILIISYIVANCSILIFALTESFVLMALARLMLGIVGSFSMLICFQFIKRCFPVQKIVFITGLVSTYAAFGTLLSQTPLMLAIKKFGWQTSLLFNFLFGLLLCIFTIFFVQDLPPNIQQKVTNGRIFVWQSVKKVIANFQNWLVGLCISLYSLPGLFLNVSLGVLYLQQVKGFTEIEGSYIISFSVIGSIIGPTLIGWLSDKFYTRKTILTITNFLTLIIFIIIIYIANLSTLAFAILFFLFGLLTGVQVVYYPLLAGNNPQYLVGTATGFGSVLTALSGAFIPFLGKLIDINKDTTSYPSNSYHYVMLTLTIILIVSMLLTFFIKETKSRS